MDLIEVGSSKTRHPWETARAVAIERILRDAESHPNAVLDYGCGDGFTGERVLASTGAKTLLGFDIHLQEEQCRARSHGQVRYIHDWVAAGEQRFDLALLCDVIEHVPDDRLLLAEVRKSLNEGGQVLITVPAFQSLFTDHDRALKHFRRYTLRQLEDAVLSSGFAPIASGYLFSSLLPSRAVTKLIETLRPKSDQDHFGIGTWTASPVVTKAIESVLTTDNAALLGLAARGIKLPGLSAWALCNQVGR